MKKGIRVYTENKNVRKVTMITAYDYTSAKLVSESGIDSILVGDSLGNVIMGYETTVPVTMEDMIHHGAAVVRGAGDTMVVVDMPFMSYQGSVYDAVMNAGRIMKETGCTAVKLEGGVEYADRIRAIVNAGIPVCAHIGLTPQSVNQMGYKVQGTDEASAKKLLEDAHAVEDAGAFAVVLECVPERLAKLVTESLHITTIGIGAGVYTDGQVLVFHDMLNYGGNTPAKFVKQFADLHSVIVGALKDYKNEVENSEFPSKEYKYGIKDEVLDKIYSK